MKFNRRLYEFSCLLGYDAVSLGGCFQTGLKMILGKWNLEQRCWENLKYRKVVEVLRETSRFYLRHVYTWRIIEKEKKKL
jgi:hypothetical protein